MMGKVQRDSLGRILPGSPSLNPRGRPAEEARLFTSDQVTKDFLGLLDEPVTVKVGGEERRMPAIIAIYKKMVQLAAEGDWGAIKKVVELREKYANARTETLASLINQISRIRKEYAAADETMPDQVWDLVDQAQQVVNEGALRPG